ncbi:protein-glutamate O-methyltransferase CheR [Rickettsiales bacterium]|nr:protein-glutamate O-methyltransferase CheR [Rickettsiales bacterium]
MALSPKVYTAIVNIVKNKSGIALGDNKEYLIESRLMPIAKKYELPTLDALVNLMNSQMNDQLLNDIIEAMTTNESFFFRDIKPFDNLRDHAIPYLLKNNPGKKDINIWSAACSTGQEPYSIAMTLEELPQLKDIKYKITATDLDTKVLKKAKEGIYTQFEVQRGMPISLLIKYFTQKKERWLIKDILKEPITFEPFNLMDNPVSLGNFDIVFCRNVLIYFDNITKEKVLKNLADRMPKGSLLFLGAAENFVDIKVPFESFDSIPGIYKRI